MDEAKLDELIAQAKALVAATEALKTPVVPEPVDTFSQAEVDAVLAKVEELKTAIAAMKTPETPVV